MDTRQNRVYFPGLNGLRFLAAFAVIITHIELMKKYFGLGHLWEDSGQKITTFPLDQIMEGKLNMFQPLVSDAGPLGVTFFFVLSGFLITYLLQAEKQHTGHIAIRKFYLRRILRIWPLYFFILILGFVVLPNSGDWFYVREQSEALTDHYWLNLLLYIFIFPNLAYSITGAAVPCIGQSWSIGVEEQFYLVWPVLIKFTKKPVNVVLGATAVLVVIKALVLLAWMGYTTPPEWLRIVKEFMAMSKLECMTIGGAGAWLLFNKRDWLMSVVSHRSIEIGAYVGVLALLYLTPALIQDGVHVLYGVLFLIIILNISCNPRSVFKLEGPRWNFLGKVSYGLYMYHLIIIVGALYFLQDVMGAQGDLSLVQNLSLYVGVIGLTIFVSHLSYQYIERPFILSKSRHQRVISGEDARSKS